MRGGVAQLCFPGTSSSSSSSWCYSFARSCNLPRAYDTPLRLFSSRSIFPSSPALRFIHTSTMQQPQSDAHNVEGKDEEELTPLDVAHNLQTVKQQISDLCQKLTLHKEPRLVAISKKKPASFIKACFEETGHVYFGENYVQELVDKAKQLPTELQWHFVGHLQSNKCKQLCAIPNLHMVETVDSVKLAKALNKAAAAATETRTSPLNVMVQINTSSEDTKSGTTPETCVEVVEEVIQTCPNLRFCGLMTIGRPGPSPEIDFRLLRDCRKRLCEKLQLNEEEVELSMGMSSDYLTAIEEGSTNVRVGSSIFGARVYS
ncbi:Pyridoxal phosphate homeostasis protein [Balamuthia mandrillaris]